MSHLAAILVVLALGVPLLTVVFYVLVRKCVDSEWKGHDVPQPRGLVICILCMHEIGPRGSCQCQWKDKAS